MNKPLSTAELAQLAVPTLFPDHPKPPLTRYHKLMRFAEIVRKHDSPFVIFHRLEYATAAELDRMDDPRSAFALAAADPVLAEAGLGNTSVGEAKRFFELDQAQLHEFSCDCGGVIDNTQMANRIERLAGPAPTLAQGATAVVVDSRAWTL